MGVTLTSETFFESFRDLAAVVHAATNVNDVMAFAVERIADIFKAKGAILRIVNLQTEQMDLYAAYGLSEKYLTKGHVSSRKMITELCRKKKVIIIDDILNDPRVQYPQEAIDEGIVMMLDAPLILREDVVGVLRVLFSEKRTFSEKELDFLVSVAQLCACAIDKARLFEEQESRYERLALQTEKLSALGRMAAGIAHEINNPLSSILLYSSNAMKRVGDLKPVKEALEIIISETIRCRSIIQDLLEFARDRAPSKVRAKLNVLVERALSLLENECRLHQIHVEKKLNTNLPELMLDVNQIQQVVVNLLLNAVEAIGSGGKISVTTGWCEDGQAQFLAVEDTGCGMAPELREKIFEPFFSTKPKGTGLGLAVSYGIVSNHGGIIKVESQPGQGSRFIVELPFHRSDGS
ncbi:MAG: ATP-binding protein [Desulfosoma sp.]